MCATFTKAEEREREKENATTRKECSRYSLVLLYVRLSLNCDLFFSRVHRALFEETLKAFLWRFSFFFLLWSRFLKIFFSNLSDADALAKNDSLTKKKKNSPPPLKKDIEKRGASVKYAATKNNDDDEYDGWC